MHIDKTLQSERITFLATAEIKQRLTRMAESSGISLGELIRRRVLGKQDSDEASSEEAELAMLVEQVNDAVPRINAALAQMSSDIRELRAENDAFFAEKGIGR